ncbi:transposase [Streptomyces coerulescens]|uniref:Transposase n=1 Tax=Streptomyces coerulescens TaxID=29304 RepID=A0ABW0CVR6_STRCD
MTRVQLTDPDWEFIEPYLPIGEYGLYPERLRQQFEGVIWRFKTGGQWREMPTVFGAWSTVHNRFRQWRDAGVFEALLEGLITEAAKRGEADLSLVSIDSTTARAHHDAAGMHLDEDVVTALEKVRVRGPVGRTRVRPGAVAGDKAYSSRGNHAHLRKRRIKAVIPEKKDQAANRKKKGSRGGRPVSHDADLYKERNTVELLINKLRAWRGIATRYDKTPDSYLAGLHLRASMIWIKDLTRPTR